MNDMIVPTFGDETPAAAGTGRRKICFICSKGNLDMAYPALIMGNGALGEGIETHFFFTFWGLDIITKRYMNNLRFSMIGNTAMHLPQAPGWKIPSVMGSLPGMTTMATKMLRKQISDLEVPPVGEFLDQIVDMGGELWACRMSFDMAGLAKADLYDGVKDVINVTDFIEKADGAQVIFI